ncbi:MAG: hypothetical protein QMD88_08680 [Coprothermobacterota bacterium]|nr:hypothetical protein [Coprothermobacterota bacterium]
MHKNPKLEVKETKREVIRGLVAVFLAFLIMMGLPTRAIITGAYSESNFTFPETTFDNGLTFEEQGLIQTIERDQELILAVEQKIAQKNDLDGTELLPKSFIPISNYEPKWYSYVPVSGSMRYTESIWYGRYSGMDCSIIQVNWVPASLQLTTVILDVTDGNSTQYRWVGGSGSVTCNVDPSHAYLIGFMNYAGADTTITFNGTLTLVFH